MFAAVAPVKRTATPAVIDRRPATPTKRSMANHSPHKYGETKMPPRHPRTEDASFLMSFSGTVSDDYDDFIMSQAPSYESTTNMMCSNYCGALTCWNSNVPDSPILAETRNPGTTSHTGGGTATQRTALPPRVCVSEDEMDVSSTLPAYSLSLDQPPTLPHVPISLLEKKSSSSNRETALLLPRKKSISLQQDPILQARETAGDCIHAPVVSPSAAVVEPTNYVEKLTKHVRFCEPVTVCSNIPQDHVDNRLPLPLENSTMFWTEAESNTFRRERRDLLRSFQKHINFSPLVPWTEDTESIRGLEDHYADMIGRTSSYFIRKRHGDLILREFRRTRNGPDAVQRLSVIAACSSEEDKERALEMAQLDVCMAKEEGEEGATTSPLGADIFSSGEALLHSLMVGIRDYGS